MLNWFRNRYHILYILLAVASVLILHRLFVLQVVDGASYRQISDDSLSRNTPVKAPRGEILDRYGRPLVTNRLGMSVAVQKPEDDKPKLNLTLLSLLSLLEGEESAYVDTLPISAEEPYTFQFTGESEEDRAQQEKTWKSERNFDENATAADVIARYAEKYAFDEGYTQAEMRALAGVYCDMEKRNFSASTPYVFATDIGMEAVTCIKEQRDLYPYATVYTEPVREYVNGNLAAHILGRVGIIGPEEYAELKDQGYGMTDYLGKQGVEKAFESYLKGTDGVNSLERTVTNGESKLVYSRDPIPGKSVLLTIDLDLQRAAEEALEKHIKQISSSGEKGWDADSGAAVVVDVNSGEILALASYPDFDPARFNADYTALYNDPAKPMLNRAINGLYEPGSTFKMVTAAAAMQTGFLDPNQYIQTKGIYHYLGHDFTCLIYSNGGGTHGTINVSKAIEVSCNYFFYTVAAEMGIEPMEDYARQFGLGEYTGIELADEEAKGYRAGPETREKNGGEWYPGDVLQAAIGQSDNRFTPLQMANYVATLANGGTRYEAHLLKAVKSNTEHKIVEETVPKVANEVQIDSDVQEAIFKGMRGVIQNGTGQAAFSGFPVEVAGKTGTAQVARGSDNGTFVGFAPYDNPQIAVAVVVEHGASGSAVAGVAADIFDAYFMRAAETNYESTPVGELLP